MRRARVLLLAAGVAALSLGTGLTFAPATAGCPDPDYPCDPPPHPIKEPVYLEWGCGTVTAHVLKWEKTVDYGLCPGPMP